MHDEGMYLGGEGFYKQLLVLHRLNEIFLNYLLEFEKNLTGNCERSFIEFT